MSHTGYELAIIGFGAKGWCGMCKAQLTNNTFRQWMKAEVQYAKSKGITLSAYTLMQHNGWGEKTPLAEVILMLKTPYCIGFLAAVILNLIMPEDKVIVCMRTISRRHVLCVEHARFGTRCTSEVDEYTGEVTGGVYIAQEAKPEATDVVVDEKPEPVSL